MDQTAVIPTAADNTSSARRRSDRRILLLFAVLAGSSIAVSAAMYILVQATTIYGLVSAILGSLTFSFLVVGFPVYLRHRRSSLTPRRRILRWMVTFSIAITVASMSAIALVSIYAPDLIMFDDFSTGTLLLVGAVLAITFFTVYMLICFAALLVVFGIIGVLVALERLLTPWVLGQVARLSGTRKPSLLGRAIRWMFDIPDVLDTKTLSLGPTDPRTRVSLSDLKAPVLWQLLFGFVLGIYISFNPFLSDRSPTALLSLFSLLTTASTLFPFLILPWFLFRRLGVSIMGQAKQFTLYNGIRARVLQSYFAVGTIVILIRLSIQEIAVAFETYVAAFSVFIIALLVSALLSTFVYLNYFENELAEDVVEELRGTEVQVVVREGLKQAG